ncbi:unnamed protein product [Cladocopium goreaui]|uniref:GPS domain-containing protein n=1 Tax=Cladocopium goreaui TaxID=2562237 RepID=A0A9P1BQ30_9DINO|nr:unnamed protein product [Cladocopium goreaui]
MNFAILTPLFSPFYRRKWVPKYRIRFCRRTFWAGAVAGETAVEVPAETSTGGFTHFLVYASSALAEQSTPAWLSINDRHASVSSLQFEDLDLDPGELGGPLSWVPVYDVAAIAMYNIYLATDYFGSNRQFLLSSTKPGADVPPETALGSFSHLVIYTSSSLAEQSTPVSFLLSDAFAIVANLLGAAETKHVLRVGEKYPNWSLVDLDLDETDLGGTLEWDEPLETAKVTHYMIYFMNANNTNESDTRDLAPRRGAYFANVSVGVDTLPVPPETTLRGYGGLSETTHVGIYTLSTLVEQSTPAILEIVDAYATVMGTFFVDKDLDALELGGRINWQYPSDVSRVTNYNIYLAQSMDGLNRSQRGNVAGVDFLDIPPDTALESYSHVLVYTESSLVEQTTPDAFLLSDAASSVQNVSFPDEDLDLLDLGGLLEWLAPVDMSQVTHYMVYFAKPLEDPAACVSTYLVNVTNDTELVAVISGSMSFQLDGASAVQVEQAVRSTLSSSLNVAPDAINVVIVSGARRLEERLLAQSWTVSFTLVVPVDAASSVISAANGHSASPSAFANLLAPELIAAGVASSSVATLQLLQFAEVSVQVINADLALGLVSTATTTTANNSNTSDDSDADEDDMPTVRRLSSLVSMVAASDVPGSLSISKGWCRQFIIRNPPGEDNVTVVPDTAIGNYTHFLVYTASSLVEQTTPVALEIFDEFASVSNISFVDLDLDLQQLGGNISWLEPSLTRRVEEYLIYLAEDTMGLQRSLVDRTTQGSTAVAMPPETSLQNFTFLLIATRSALVEQSTPSFLGLVDEAPVVFNISLDDLDLDETDLGGRVSWQTSDDRLVQNYVFYFASPGTTSCSDVSEVATVAVVFGSLSFALEGEAWQVDSATRAALAAALKVAPEQLAVRLRDTSRRLYESRLLPVWHLEFQVLLPPWTELDGDVVKKLQSKEHPLLASAKDLLLTTERVQQVAVDTAREMLKLLDPWDSPASSERRLTASQEGGAALCRSMLKTVPVPASQFDLAPEQSSLVEQTTPFAHVIVDVFVGTCFIDAAQASVSQIQFLDLDLDLDQYGGTISWSEPSDLAAVQIYRLYFNNSAGRLAIGSASPGSSSFALPAEMGYEGGEILIYTASSLVEQSTPTTAELSDTLAVIGNATFPDFDLDATDLGGTLQWEPPNRDVSKVSHYMIYMARYFENGTGSCDDGTAVNLAASISGSVTLQLPGVEESQVETAVRATLLAAFPGLNSDALLISVVLVTGRRRLEAVEGRRLSSLWDVSYQATLPLVNVVAATSTANAFSEDVASFAELLKPELLAVGVPSAVLDSGFSVMSFSRLAMDIVDSTYLAAHFADLMAAANQSDTSDDEEYSDGVGNSSRRLIAEGRRLDYVGSIFSVSLSWCRRLAGTAPLGSNSMTVPPETALGNYSHYLIYAASSLAEQSYPLALLIDDSDASVSSIRFHGQDLDFYDLGGDLTWLPPNDTERLNAYLVYLAEGATGLGRSQLGSALAPQVLKLHVPSNTARENFTHFTVYTRSVLVEQTTPAFLAIADEASRANNVSFTDDDLDPGEIGGNLTWVEPEDYSEVLDYVIYMAEDRFGTNRSLLGNVSFDTYSFLVPENTPLLRHTHLLVYARSALEEQTTPASVVIVETLAIVSNVSFLDLDLDANDLGGRVTWDRSTAASERVRSFVVYLAESFMPVAGRFELSELSSNVETLDVAPETPLRNFSYLLVPWCWIGQWVFAKSALAEQTTPAAVALEDQAASASSVAFYDRDLDEGDIGGVLQQWLAPLDASLVQFYEVYLANGTFNHWNRQHQSTIPVTQQSLDIPAETTLTLDVSGGLLTNVLVYTRSTLVEQSTPSSHVIVDEFASVSNVLFTDLDLDPAELGGVVSWAPPPLQLVQSVHLYLADSADGRGYRSQVEQGVIASRWSEAFMMANDTDLDLLYDTQKENFTHLVVYTRSSLVEQTTPVARSLSDVAAMAA